MPIDRTFQDIPDDKLTEANQLSFLADLRWHHGSTWDDLLKSQRVLIISEAGAGKTYECRERQKALWAVGEPAFYLELAGLAQRKLCEMLSAEEETRFAAWLASQSDTATFFLDSIDELKLSLGSFKQALNSLAKAVPGRLGRIRVVVTSRPIPIDQQLLREMLPIPPSADARAAEEAFADIAMGDARKNDPEKKAAPEPWRNVALLPLSNEQMKQMAVSEKVGDPDALIAAIRRHNAEEFARRPQDLIELCADWHEHGRIRTHREQVASNVSVKLKPRTDGPEKVALSPDKALEGASRLALAATLTRKLTLRHSVEADRNCDASERPLDPAEILSDWSAEERATLLERPLFGFASYGRVRFHHRSVIEYLAAQRILRLRERGMPTKAIKRLLFATTPQRELVVRPSMIPVTAWMALHDDRSFDEVLAREPSILFDHGDPESLSAANRQRALRAYVDRYSDGGWRGLRVPRVQVHRFASDDLGPLIQELWTSGIENPEVRDLLLSLIGAGKNQDCADIAYYVAADISRGDDERLDGLQALIGLDDARLDVVTSSIANEPSAWSNRLTRHAIVRLFPTHLPVDRLCKILARVEEKARSVGDMTWHLPRLIEHAAVEDGALDALCQGLTALVGESLSWDDNAWPHTTTKRQFLVPALLATCRRQLAQGVTSDALFRSTAMASRLGDREYESSEHRQALRKALHEAPVEIRMAVFLADDAFTQSQKAQTDVFRRFFEVAHHGPVALAADRDAAWINVLLADQSRPADQRAMLLEAASTLRPESMERTEHLASLRPLVADLPELVARLDEWTKPPKRNAEWERMEREHDKRRKQEARRNAKARASWIAFWREVASKPDAVFADDRSGNTAWNLWRAMERSGDDSRASGWNRRFVEAQFGKDVADRLRLAVMKYWRDDRPTLRRERPADQKGAFLIRWQLGLAGVAAEAEDPSWAGKLTQDEAMLAARYAPIELNGYPAWLEALVAAHPGVVDSILGDEVSAELAEPPAQHCITLQNIRYAGPTVQTMFAPRLRAWLDAKSWQSGPVEEQTANYDRLRQTIEILLKHDDEETIAHIRTLAIGELQGSAIGPLSGVWLPAVFRLDPVAGTDVLEAMLQPFPPSQYGEPVNWFANLFGDRHDRSDVSLAHPDFTPTLLLRLTRLAYQHVQPDQDLERREGVFTPDVRDNAQSARSHILGALLATIGPEGWAAKLQMIGDPLFGHFKDRIAAIARERAAEEADASAFAEAEVVSLERYGELPPKTRDDMFALMNDRLTDLDDLLLRDDSPRAAWELIKDEKIMRQQIAHELRSNANKAYVVDQEAVTADEKETDLRLRSSVSDQEAVIELKIGEKPRSGAQLRAAIKDQLVTKYMAPEGRRAGCFLVTVNSDRSWNHPDTGAPLDFAGMIAMLNDEAARLEREMGGTIRLVAKGLDLRPRLGTERQSSNAQNLAAIDA